MNKNTDKLTVSLQRNEWRTLIVGLTALVELKRESYQNGESTVAELDALRQVADDIRIALLDAIGN